MRKLVATLCGTVLATAGALVVAVPPAAAEPVTVTFEYTGAVQNWVVPAGVHDLAVELRGAAGGGSSWNGPSGGGGFSSGGAGGLTRTFVAVTPGELLRVVVGGLGASGADGGAAGFNGGGAGIESDDGFGSVGRSGGGGGASDIRQGGIQLSHRVAIAGGGGGAPADGLLDDTEGDGSGGGLSGNRGIGPPSPTDKFHGDGGTQTTGGAGGAACEIGFGVGTAGVLGLGGDGAGGSEGGAGGGGGGGLYGGGGGGGKNCSGGPAGAGGGGGGSGYEATGLGTMVTGGGGADPGGRGRPGRVTITYAPAPPGPPQNVSATAGNGQATVSFNPPTDSGTFPVTGYRAICGNPDSGPSNTGSSSPIVVSELANGATVTCIVQAISAAGDGFFSAPSNSVTPNAPAGPTAPGAPRNVSVTAGNQQATVSFAAPLSNGGSAILDYTATCGSKTKTGAGSPLVVTGLTNGVTVGCTVTARNAVGTGLASSPAVLVRPATVPGVPRNVSAAPGNARATVTFYKPLSNGGSGILDYTAKCGTKSTTGAGSPLVVTGLANGVTVNCTVKARNAVGSGPASSPVSVRPRP